jgi:acyl-CoA thioester hydrolase
VSADFRHRVRVRYGECDSQGVLFNAHYLAFADLTLTERWRSALPGGYAAMVASGTDMVAAEAHVRPDAVRTRLAPYLAHAMVAGNAG